jgi:hypothetical protein
VSPLNFAWIEIYGTTAVPEGEPPEPTVTLFSGPATGFPMWDTNVSTGVFYAYRCPFSFQSQLNNGYGPAQLSASINFSVPASHFGGSPPSIEVIMPFKDDLVSSMIVIDPTQSPAALAAHFE